MILLTEKIRIRFFLFWFFSCDHLNDTLCQDPTKITHEKSEKTCDTVTNDSLNIRLATSDKQKYDTNNDEQKNQ